MIEAYGVIVGTFARYVEVGYCQCKLSALLMCPCSGFGVRG